MRLSIADNLTLSTLDRLGPVGLVSEARMRAVTQRWIDTLAIRCRDPEQRVADLSGGNQQKVALGRLPNWVQQILTGVIIVTAVAIDRFRRRK